jgi:conjugative transfer signal peptidase TraF
MKGSLAMLAGGGAALGATLLAPRPAAPTLLWNTTASAPLGLWIVQADPRPVVGDWLALRPPPALDAALDARGVLPAGVLLLKRVAAVAPSQVCRRGDAVWIDGHPIAHALSVDRQGRALPQWRACRPLRPGELFLLNAARGSFDSRYFGPLTTADVRGRARPWLTTGGG